MTLYEYSKKYNKHNTAKICSNIHKRAFYNHSFHVSALVMCVRANYFQGVNVTDVVLRLRVVLRSWEKKLRWRLV